MKSTVLFIGDIVGKAGRRTIDTLLQNLIREFHVDLVVANGENAAGGVGITPKIAQQLFSAGIHILTSGNHIWQKREIIPYIRHETRLIRPLNYPPDTPGMGSCVITLNNGSTFAVINALGRVFMESFSCPFRAIETEIRRLAEQNASILVDFHAEATSEKEAMGWFLDGKVAAVLGTHTHVQTADERILPGGTAYITDVGMTGAMDAVLGVDKEKIVDRFLTYMPVRFESSLLNPYLNGVVLTLDSNNGQAIEIQRIRRSIEV